MPAPTNGYSAETVQITVEMCESGSCSPSLGSPEFSMTMGASHYDTFESEIDAFLAAVATEAASINSNYQSYRVIKHFSGSVFDNGTSTPV